MFIKCNREQLLKVFAVIASVAPSRAAKEILTNIKFVAADGQLFLHGTDMEMWMLSPVEGVEVITPGAALLSVARFGMILRESTSEMVEIEVGSDSVISVRGAHFEYNLPSANPDEYPSCKPFDGDKWHEIPCRVLADGIRKTHFATDPDSSRFALGGVLLDLKEDGDCQIVGTDGRRLACVQFAAKSVNKHWTDGVGCIMPERAAVIVQRALPQGDEVCKVQCGYAEVVVECGGVVIGSRLVEGRYPNWRQVIPNTEAANWAEVSIPAGPLYSAVRQASVVADKETRGLDFTLSSGRLQVGGQAAELGKSLIEMPIAYAYDDERKIKLDFRFVSDFLRVCDPSEPFVLNVGSSTQAALFQSGGYSYVVMPMQLSE